MSLHLVSSLKVGTHSFRDDTHCWKYINHIRAQMFYGFKIEYVSSVVSTEEADNLKKK